MTLGELKAWVLRTVKRPELTVESLDAINAAIEFAATQGDFSWDLVESEIAISSTAYAQSIVISSTFTRFRKIKYLRPEGFSVYLKWRDSSRIFDEKGKETLNVWYRAGDNIVFKLSELQSNMLYGFYQYPARVTLPAATNGYTEQMAACIHDLAASRMFEDIGNAEEAARLEKRGMRYLLAHKMDKQDGVSHS